MNIFRKLVKSELFLLIYTSLFSISVYSGTTDTSPMDINFLQTLTQKHPVYKFDLPINVFDHNISLYITVPETLIFKYERPGNPQFIQYGDKDILFSIANERGGKLQATESLAKGLKVMEKDSQVTILDKADHDYSGYIDGYRIVKVYDTKKNTTDIIYFYAASGPYDSVSVLYAIRMNKDDNLDTVLQNVKNGFKANVKIVDKPSSH